MAVSAAMAKTETVSCFDEHIKLTIDWTIPNFSALKMKHSLLRSERTVIGTSGWNISMCPTFRKPRPSTSTDTHSVLLADKVAAPVLKTAALHYVTVKVKALKESGQVEQLWDADKKLTREMFDALARWSTR
ncbi:hypothetical protein RvY_06956 [Ramazzottius varieornatus]|uniref:MATH domain-containing protein n=1 Tax=Ramazzottius varieornatus TaxID=947166 RepID=A0A1D1V359_RAMVA|nr:hypothetical protein RvY_06956 [Ramazzottius varieornatus]